MQTWYWHHWQDLPYLKCSLLEQWPHGFLSRHFSPRTPAELVEVLHPTAAAYRVKQVHGNRVLKTGEVESLSREISPEAVILQEADGLLTQKSSEAVWVASADCVPVLIADVNTGLVAAVHAGWRGTATKIVPQAIAQFQSQGSQLADLRFALGPAISGEVYQVSSDVAVKLGETILPPSNSTSETEVLEALFQLPNSPLLEDSEPNKVRVDVRRVNTLQLEQLGITPEQVAVAPHCTYQEPNAFFSYRREHLKKVQWSGIVSY